MLLDIEQLDQDLRVAQQYKLKALQRLEYIVEENMCGFNYSNKKEGTKRKNNIITHLY